jgi:superfamily II DNA or RNA helicase
MPLRDVEFPVVMATSTVDLIRQFYVPALSRSVSYDRGVGFFSSKWIELAAEGLSGLASNGGSARLVASPILDAQDWETLKRGAQAQNDPVLLAALQKAVRSLERELRTDTLSAIAWMIADGLLEVRLAVPIGDLDGDFHDKFGVFHDELNDEVAFHGSPNDSKQAFHNYESISIFCSWIDRREAERVRAHKDRFDRIWNNKEPNLRVFPLPEAIRENIAELRHRSSCPYKPKATTQIPQDRRWRHQIDAEREFLAQGRGILEMATGTGKTRTALRICQTLVNRGEVDTIIVSADGVDLLEQWHKQLLALEPALSKRFVVFRHYEDYHERERFDLNPRRAMLLISRPALAPVMRTLNSGDAERTLLIHDEVHRLGSPGNRKSLAGQSDNVRYRLGLSATPEREYDQEGTQFIEEHIGKVIFSFGLADAIRGRILSPFDYYPLEYAPDDNDRRRLQDVYRRAEARERAGEPMSQEEIWIELARVHKTSLAKLPVFGTFLEEHARVLERCIIFVETREYGDEVLRIVHRYRHDFHTYYTGEESETLRRFATGEIECLLTCHRLSEGIDIRSIRSVILFSSARTPLETIQRMGRCLRIDPDQPAKRANVVDFIRRSELRERESDESDQSRRRWLEELSRIEPDEDYQ